MLADMLSLGTSESETEASRRASERRLAEASAHHTPAKDSRSRKRSKHVEPHRHHHRRKVGHYSGNPDDYKPYKEWVSEIAPDGILILAWTNAEYLDFAINWYRHLQNLNVTAYMLGAMDEKVLQALVEMGVSQAFWMSSALQKIEGDISWGSSHFISMGHEKIPVIDHFATMGFDVLMSDIDVSWVKNPIPYVQQFPDADILTSSDHLTNTSSDEGLEYFPEAAAAFNVGMFLIRKTGLEFAKEWDYVMSKDDKYWEQNAFNDLLRRKANFTEKRSDRLFKGYDGKLLVGVLPVALFASGHTYFVQNLAEKMGFEPYAVHATFQFSGTSGKKHRFRERHLWLADPPEYFQQPEGGLLSFDLRVDQFIEPAAQLSNSGKLEDFKPHFDLVNAQLIQLRNAMAVASTLGRTLVLPRMLAGADRWWAPHKGIIPGSSRVMSLPFFSPADHILDLQMMLDSAPPDGSGPGVRFREYGFLDNPSLPKKIVEDRVDVHVCEEFETSCTADLENVHHDDFGLRLERGRKDAALRDIFKAYKDKKLLHFDDMSAAFGGFEKEDDLVKFQAWSKMYTSIWCCVEQTPGHVWYDMWWDVPNHVDRHNRKIEKWEPRAGP